MAVHRFTNAEILFLLQETHGVGRRSIERIVREGRLADCPHLSDSEWVGLGLTARQAEAAAAMFDPAILDARQREYGRRGIRIVTRLDAHYPALLHQIADPPQVLYALGDLSLLARPAVAIVGTRNPTAYGRRIAASLAESLSGEGVAVVSGLARGIDAIAHEGALKGGGGTIAVLGTAIGTVYPPQNASLYRSIAERGLILSEYPLGTRSHPGLFPQRNRVIAGLTRGTLVVEAAARSGSLITAELALSYNREVYAVPGSIHSEASAGANALIGDGAKPVGAAADILKDLLLQGSWQPEPSPDELSEQGEGQASAAPEPLTPAESDVLRLLRDRPHTADELLERLMLPFGHLHAVLINLSIKRRIEQHPGSLYSLL